MSVLAVGILVFDEVEVLDFAGPFEVFSVVNEALDRALTEVSLVGATGAALRTRGGMLVQPQHSYANAPAYDVLIVPGGDGRRAAMVHAPTLAFVRQQAATAQRVASVCTGAFILAHAGVLDGSFPVATYHTRYDELATAFPALPLGHGQRFTGHDRVWTSAGVSAGIDLSLALLDQLFGPGAGDRTARAMEYERRIGAVTS